MAINGFRLANDYIIGIKNQIPEAIENRDPLSFAESTAETSRCCSSLVAYIFWIGQNRTQVIDFASKNITLIIQKIPCLGILNYVSSLIEAFSKIAILSVCLSWMGENLGRIENFLSHTFGFILDVPFMEMMSYAGVATLALSSLKEMATFARQISFISIFQKHAWRENPESLLEEIVKASPLFLKRSIPEWMQIKNPREDLKLLLSDITNAETKVLAVQILDKIRAYAIKKTLYQTLVMIGCGVGIGSAIGFFVAFPPSLAIALIAVPFLIVGIKYLMLRGYVENPNGGFSFTFCLPQMMQEWIKRYDEYQNRRYILPDFLKPLEISALRLNSGDFNTLPILMSNPSSVVQ